MEREREGSRLDAAAAAVHLAAQTAGSSGDTCGRSGAQHLLLLRQEGEEGYHQLLYSHPVASVITNGQQSEFFSLNTGTRQGYSLSPLLFAIAIEPLAAALSFFSLGKMGQKRDLTDSEKSKTLSEGCSTLEIAKILGRHHRTIKCFVANTQKGCKKRVYERNVKLPGTKREATRNPLSSSAVIFQNCNLPGVSKKYKVFSSQRHGQGKKG
ncbi:hypothetical protein L3Q82_024104 [Scortum barcoo]|uniref:Uncharacterized protein n=1 Tax=Scortum barcoo TaxID=214431 RepID=A0ACB8WU04_9TELE|nr:hypothetical protein L3Q82_024104 [Scortum barcoo]